MRYNNMSLDLCLKQLHVVHMNVFHRIQYIRLLLFYSFIFQSCKFQSPLLLIGFGRGHSLPCCSLSIAFETETRAISSFRSARRRRQTAALN